MEHKMVIIPFDLETAKRIREGKISGRIVTEKGQIGITPIYKRRLWSKEVNVINDKQ